MLTWNHHMGQPHEPYNVNMHDHTQTAVSQGMLSQPNNSAVLCILPTLYLNILTNHNFIVVLHSLFVFNDRIDISGNHTSPIMLENGRINKNKPEKKTLVKL